MQTMAMPGASVPGQSSANSNGAASALSAPFQEQQQQIATFVEESELPSSSMTMAASRSFLAPAKDSLGNSVVGFLERPLEYQNIDWAATSMRGAKLTEIRFPGDWLKSTMIKEKIAGFRYLRCNYHVRVQVNAQPMNAGRLFMVWQPFWNQMNQTPASSLTIPGLTGMPLRVDLDLSEASVFEIMIPYCGNTSHFDLVRGMGTSGAVQLYVYSPLTGLSEVDATVFIWASDIDVQLPTALPLAVPSWTKWSKSNITNIQADDGEVPDSEFMESRPEPSQARLDKERKPGLITKILDTGGKMAMAMSAIPKIGVFALAGGAIARGLARLTSIFGWSRPLVEAVPTQIRPMLMRHAANYNGCFDGKVMALDWDNQTDIPTFMYGTDEDEMSFDYIFRRPVYLDAFTIDDGMTANQLLWKWPVDPAACRKYANTNVLSPNPLFTGAGIQHSNNYLSYHSNMFTFWRGSLIYEVKIVKTAFHTTRIKVLYVPGATMATDVTTLDHSKCYFRTIDIQAERTSFGIKIPYNWYTPWKELHKGTTTTDILEGVPQGMLYVVLLNALKHPSTTAGEIECIVEIRAGDDFQFAVPGVCDYIFPLVDDQDTVTELSTVALAGGEVQADVEEMFANPTTTSVDINALGIGEVALSHRVLLKRYMYLDPATVDTGSFIRPYRNIPVGTVANPTDRGTRLVKFNDVFRWTASLFRLMSGPMRLSLVSDKDTAGPVYDAIMHPAEWADNPQITGLGSLVLNSIVTQHKTQEPVLELEVPFYQPYPAILTDLGNPTLTSTEATPVANQYFKWTPTNQGTEIYAGGLDMTNGANFRHIGERFSFGLLLGPPPTISFAPAP